MAQNGEGRPYAMAILVVAGLALFLVGFAGRVPIVGEILNTGERVVVILLSIISVPALIDLFGVREANTKYFYFVSIAIITIVVLYVIWGGDLFSSLWVSRTRSTASNIVGAIFWLSIIVALIVFARRSEAKVQPSPIPALAGAGEPDVALRDKQIRAIVMPQVGYTPAYAAVRFDDGCAGISVTLPVLDGVRLAQRRNFTISSWIE
jgi:hypothetical protein